MKTFLSILLIGFTISVSSQNRENNNIIQQQVNLDNNIGNYSKNPTIQINTRNINVPSINLNINHVKKEKYSPKRWKYFRIKTGNSSSGSVSHKLKIENKSLKKKLLKPIKCWAQRTFKHTAKFHLSCECFQF
jgi:hypothetical protein